MHIYKDTGDREQPFRQTAHFEKCGMEVSVGIRKYEKAGSVEGDKEGS